MFSDSIVFYMDSRDIINFLLLYCVEFNLRNIAGMFSHDEIPFLKIIRLLMPYKTSNRKTCFVNLRSKSENYFTLTNIVLYVIIIFHLIAKYVRHIR